MSLVMKVELDDEGEEVEAELEDIWNLRCFFSLSSSGLYPPVPQFWIFVPNFAIHHSNSTVSAFISNSAAAHGPLSALHRSPIPAYLRTLGLDP